MIALACDHTGIELKKEMMKLLDSMGLEWKDFGTDTAVSCDYPVYGYRAAKAVASGECDRGILICGTGIGIGIAASKVKGTRVCTCSDVYSAELSKRHNNSNILTMGARVVEKASCSCSSVPHRKTAGLSSISCLRPSGLLIRAMSLTHAAFPCTAGAAC